jgi:hypothetical protein
MVRRKEKMINTNRILGNMLGGKTAMPRMGRMGMGKRMGMGRMGIRSDSRSKNMVKYSYYDVTLEDGTEKLMYAGSKVGVKRMLESENIPYLAIKEITYEDAQKKHNLADLDQARSKTKGVYTSKGSRIMPKEYDSPRYKL